MTVETNTKVERVVEAVEALSIAVEANIQTIRAGQPRTAAPPQFQTVLDARTELATALREFLQPTLRVVSGQ